MAQPASRQVSTTSTSRVLRRRPRPTELRLPHPSWSRAVGSGRTPDGRKLADASEFWEALGV